jgi:hypothetical protein
MGKADLVGVGRFMLWIKALIAIASLCGWIWLIQNWKRRTGSRLLQVSAYALVAVGVGVYFWNGLQANYIVLSLVIAAVAIDLDLKGVIAGRRGAGKVGAHPDET